MALGPTELQSWWAIVTARGSLRLTWTHSNHEHASSFQHHLVIQVSQPRARTTRYISKRDLQHHEQKGSECAYCSAVAHRPTTDQEWPDRRKAETASYLMPGLSGSTGDDLGIFTASVVGGPSQHGVDLPSFSTTHVFLRPRNGATFWCYGHGQK